MLHHILSLILLLAPPHDAPVMSEAPADEAPCDGIRCATGQCLPRWSTCPSPREAGQQPVDAPAPTAGPVDDEHRKAARRERQAREARRAEAAENFERAVFFSQLGFGLGAGAAFGSSVGLYGFAAFSQSTYRDTCDNLADIESLTGSICSERVPGFGLSLVLASGFLIAGVVFAALAVNTRQRLGRRVTLGPRGLTMRF